MNFSALRYFGHRWSYDRPGTWRTIRVASRHDARHRVANRKIWNDVDRHSLHRSTTRTSRRIESWRLGVAITVVLAIRAQKRDRVVSERLWVSHALLRLR